MRELIGHKVNGCNDQLTVNAVDDPGPGGANHHYLISGYTVEICSGPNSVHENSVDLRFQNGPGAVNGITHEALLAVLIDRLEGFQSGPFKSHYNMHALAGLKSAQEWLHNRTKDRVKRGVEGTHEK